MDIVVKKSFLKGVIAVPGDKSISHRAVMLGGIAKGVTRIKNLLESEDTSRTIEAFKQMGVKIQFKVPGKFKDRKELIIEGKGLYLKKPKGIIDAGNSGTTMRLLAGILAGQPFASSITGDKSLCSRPMQRIILPLRKMGARIKAKKDNYAPLRIRGGNLKPLPSPYKLEVASAQLKSCLLLAHLYTGKKIELIEPAKSRNHTELMLGYFGANINVIGKSPCRHRRLSPRRLARRQGARISLRPDSSLSGRCVSIPGDISSAVFFLVGATITSNSEVLIKRVGINPTRLAIFSVLKKMGAKIELSNRTEKGGEPVADILVIPSKLKGVTIGGKFIPLIIDEIPILAVAATQATGKTVIRGARELRVKETDRISSMATELRKMGADIEELDDGMIIYGPAKLKGTLVRSYGDHRTAMALAIAGLVADGQTVVEDIGCINTSFPGFIETFKKLGANASILRNDPPALFLKDKVCKKGGLRRAGARRLVIVIDGPAGSGKSTVAKEIARKLKYFYLDTGAMYRALTLKAMADSRLSGRVDDVDLRNPRILTKLARNTKISFKDKRVFLDGKDVSSEIRDPAVSNNTHFVSIVPGVRKRMKVLQRKIGSKGGVVAEGRDMGTVIFPNADRKFYLDAKPKIRAERRFKELKEKGYRTTFKKILQDVIVRDKRDSKRNIAPLRKADDAVFVDTTGMTIEEVVNAILGKVGT